jgi:hypothetical protein
MLTAKCNITKRYADHLDQEVAQRFVRYVGYMNRKRAMDRIKPWGVMESLEALMDSFLNSKKFETENKL